jgi:hypothetical protein
VGAPVGGEVGDSAAAGVEDAGVELEAAVTAGEVLLATTDIIAVDDALASFDGSVDAGEVVASVGEDVAIWANTGLMAENRTTTARMTMVNVHANDADELFI